MITLLVIYLLFLASQLIVPYVSGALSLSRLALLDYLHFRPVMYS